MNPLVIRRIDNGPRIIIQEPQELAHDFFRLDSSSAGANAFDKRAGKGDSNRITAEDVTAINTTMRARARHEAWEKEYAAIEPLPWLSAINMEWDLIATDDAAWTSGRCTAVIAEAIARSTGPYRRESVATKVLHLKRPKIFPIIDSLVLEQIGATSQSVAVILDHLRAVGRENLETLREVQSYLAQQGFDRTLVRIQDGLLWATHPDAGLTPQLGHWERVVRLSR
jgi:hypothetical protein